MIEVSGLGRGLAPLVSSRSGGRPLPDLQIALARECNTNRYSEATLFTEYPTDLRSHIADIARKIAGDTTGVADNIINLAGY